MATADIFNSCLTGLGRWTFSALVPAAKRRVDDHDEGVVMRQKNRVLLAETQLDFLRDFPASVTPIDVRVEVTLYASEGPADGVVVAEFSEPSVEGFGRAWLYWTPSVAITAVRFMKK